VSATAVDIHPALADAAAAAAALPTKAGEAVAADGERAFSAVDCGVTLSVSLRRGRQSWLVAAARYRAGDDAPTAFKGVLEVFCRVIEGLPLQEAADHGAIHAAERLRQTKPQPLVDGIHTPRSLGALFGRCEGLIRDILAQYRAATGDRETRNFWHPALSKEWRLQSTAQQIETLRPILEAYRKAEGLGEDDMWISRIEKMRRVLVDFGEGVDGNRKPSMLMHLEQAVRDATGERLEFYMEELKDNNRIRRLGTAPMRAVS
jgi:hypothetical protein